MGAKANAGIAGAFLWLSPALALADDSSDDAASIQIDVPIEVQLDITRDPALRDLYVTIEPSASVRLASWLALEFGATFEPVEGATTDRAFEDHGLYLNAALAVASFGPVTIQAGKFSPNFSIGVEYAPGLNGDTLNADAEIAERLALAAAFNITGEGTASGVIVSGAVLRRDTSLFSESAFDNRGRLRVADGGPGNHAALESFALAVDVLELEDLPGVHLHAAYLRQAAGSGDPSDEAAWVVAANWMIEAGEAKYQLLAEWARAYDALGFGDAISISGARQDLVTLGAGGTWNDLWTGSIVWGLRHSDDPVGGDVVERFVQLTAGTIICEDLAVEAGWQRYDDGADIHHMLSMRLTSGWEYAIE